MFEKSDIDLIKNGRTKYKIVVPNNKDFYENYAYNEFKRLFKMATDIDILTISDNGTVFNENRYIISIGRTNVYETSNVDASYDELKRDGYKIITKGNTVILKGGGTYGTIYAVYGFMEKQFGYRYYASDEVKIDKKQDDKLINFNWTNIPDFENRTGGFYYSMEDDECAVRMRTFTYFGKKLDGKDFFGSWAHNHIGLYLPLDKYYEEHMDWYSPETTQLCLTNEEMWVEFAERVKQHILNTPEAEYFLLGQEDRPTFCGCKRCLEMTDKIGRSGIMMRFVNYVAREVKKWQKTACPDRVIYIGTFAYQKTQDPPVYLDDNGNYVPVDPSVVPEDNVFIMLAPISADCSVPINDEKYNHLAKKTLDGWTSLTKHCILWTYCSNFDRCFGFFDNFRVLEENYRIFKKYNFKWLYYENNCCKQGTAFQPMLCFVHSQLEWDTSLSLKDLVVEFIDNYYKAAAPFMKTYLKEMNNYYQNRKKEFSERDGRYYGTYLWNVQEETSVMCKEFYSYYFLNNMFELLTDAIKAVMVSNYEKDLEDKLVKRIMLERLTIRFLVAEFFDSEFSKVEYYDYLKQFEKECIMLGTTDIKRREPMEDVFDNWRNKF